jgi:hypothetical protein
MADLDSATPVDPRPRRLLERYAALVGGLVMETGPDLLQIDVPAPERRALGLEPGALIALSPAALDEEPEAEILVVGSALLDRLIAAIRLRGGRDDRGTLAPTVPPDDRTPALGAAVGDAISRALETELIALPVGQLVVRVTVHAGARLEERLVESSVVDLSVGVPVAPTLAELCARADGAGFTPPPEAKPGPPRPAEELLPLLFSDLERRLEPELARIRKQAEQDCAAEVSRLDGYYQRMIDEVEPTDEGNASDRKDAIRAQQRRRRAEEESRHRVGATVHPVHLVEWRVLSQRVTWEVVSPGGHRGTVASTRALTGDTAWRLHCPNCGRTPDAIHVCEAGHVACPDCGARCSICGTGACERHGLLHCAIEGHPVCAAHGSNCPACGKVHCSTHAVRCVAADHDVCSECGRQCARCGKQVCATHAVVTGTEAPRGVRWLCLECTVYCEAGTDEPVGLDEVVRCASCERHVCERHRVHCAVDQQPHCSRHLRRSDVSGRLVCEKHRVECAKAPMEIVATDEVAACGTCGTSVCLQHSAECYADRARHCLDHLTQPADLRGKHACAQHRSVCHVDGVSFSLTGTVGCPICGKAACASHRRECDHCGRVVCSRDIKERKCVTCRRMAYLPDPADELITAALAANGGEPPPSRGWRAARDATHTVVEVDLGWLRTLVFSVPHGETTPAPVILHGLLGSRRRR